MVRSKSQCPYIFTDRDVLHSTWHSTMLQITLNWKSIQSPFICMSVTANVDKRRADFNALQLPAIERLTASSLLPIAVSSSVD